MEMMTSRWTDDRMDDLKHQVDEFGRRIETGFAEQRNEMNARFDRLEKSLEVRFDKIDARFDKIDERFERVDGKFERVDAKFAVVNEQIARTQETVVGLYAMLARFSLWFAGAVAVAILASVLTLWLR
jgi:chromosome segregation ATPase